MGDILSESEWRGVNCLSAGKEPGDTYQPLDNGCYPLQISLGTSVNVLPCPTGICVSKLVVNSLCKTYKCPVFLVIVNHTVEH